MMRKFFTVLIFFLLSVNLFAGEKFFNYSERMVLHRDRSADLFIDVTARVENVKIRHGIVMDFYEEWKDEFGKKRSCSIFVKSVFIDGHRGEFHIERSGRGFKLYLGSSRSFLSPGNHTFSVHLNVRRMVQEYDNFDEVYWNIFSTIQFPVDRAEAVIVAPPGGFERIMAYRGYSGREGSREWKGVAKVTPQERSIIFTLEDVKPGEGFTIAVSFQKGFFVKEDLLFWLRELLRTRGDLLAGTGLIFIFYFLLWLMAGKDPRKGVIIPLYYPPEGISPGAARYIMKMGYDTKVLVSNIVDLAVKGYLKINEEDGDVYLERTGKAPDKDLTGDEKYLLRHLFFGREVVALSRSENRFLQEVIRKFRKKLASSYEGKFFKSNIWLFGLGFLLSAAVLIKSALSYPMAPFVIFILLWISMWSVGVYSLFRSFVVTFRAMLETHEARYIFLSVVQFLFFLVFLGGEAGGFFFLKMASDTAFLIFTIFVLFINVVFYYLLKAPTRLGRKLMDRIEGFKLYLRVAEKENLDALIKKYGVEGLFERYLPYAIALDVEKKWGEKFESLLMEYGRSDYSPSWYTGTVSGISALPAAVYTSVSTSVSSATGTSRTSAAGGGGGVGGGGGGGGVGGW